MITITVPHMTPAEQQAKTFAKFWHGGQLRKYTNTPYYLHPGCVAYIVKQVAHTEAMVIAAWLHDVLEDTDVTESEVRNTFGDIVTDYVKWLTHTDPSAGNRATRKRLDRAKLAQAPVEVKTIKLADVLDNTRSIVEYDRNFSRVYLPEMELLLNQSLRGGDETLWKAARAMIDQSYAFLNTDQHPTFPWPLKL